MTASTPGEPTRTVADSSAAPPDLALRRVGQDHGSLTALDGISLEVEAGSFLAVVGPSGCGKSTLLRLLAGLDVPTRGTIRVGTTDPPGMRRDKLVGWLAQRPALLGWKTVHENIALARTVVPVGADAPDVDAILGFVGLDDFRDARPHHLSGGMQQRVALARTLAQEAPLWLMDEPLAALDELTRESLAADLLAIWQRLRPTVVWVTHHLTEAMVLADRVVVLGPRPGRVVADLSVDLAHPRDPTDPDVQDLVRRARGALATTPARQGGTASEVVA